jgi:uncharacterized protein
VSILRRIADGRTDLVVDLLEQGQPADADDGNGVSLLQWCAYYGDVTAIRLLLAGGADLTVLGPNLGLAGAAFHGHWQLCQFLLASGADANQAIPETSETPLHNATCHPGQPAYSLVVRVLLRAGADPNLHTAESAETGDFMRDARTKGETALHRAAAFGDGDMIGLLLEAGADREARDMNGDSPLAWASWHARPDAVLRRLLYGHHRIHPDRDSGSDHGSGTSALELYLRGTPHA